jgi:peptide/nickel transport system substrate-binding protein
MNSFEKNTESDVMLHLLDKKWKSFMEETVEKIVRNLSLTEKLLFGFLILALALSGSFLLWRASQAFTVEIPEQGGSLVEGIVGSPRFINPLLAETDADRDLTSLVYSGLLKASAGGEFINNLSETYSVSPDGLTYSFKLKESIYFHDGEPLTTEDVEFTIFKARDSILKSPRRINWETVEVRVLSDREIEFVLPQPYSPFLQNATLGILPKHLWKNLEPEQFAASLLNVEPVGSGPYKIKKIKRGSDGLPTYYELAAFNDYALGEPYIKELLVKMFSNENDLVTSFKKGEVENINSVSPQEAAAFEDRSDFQLLTTPLPRIFGAFFNQNQATVFVNQEVREALEVSVDKKELVDKILSGYGVAIGSPIPVGILKNEADESSDNNEVDRIERAKEILENGGWEIDEESGLWYKETKNDEWFLRFSISTHDVPDLKNAAQILKEQWEKLGAEVEIKIFDRSDLTNNVIRPRKYDVLLFGTIIGRDLDFYPFWHSSQRNDPGLNVALYANIEADKLLEDGRTFTEKDERLKKYEEFEQIVLEERPAVFLYSPDFIYLLPSKVRNVKLGHLTIASERFLNIEKWYIETSKVWKVFVKEN